ncbi:hypothetical protein niasHS_018153 [Heterodera schachtii]|uniref:Uncharacterized protein n=1 Tax=Heterodera schachtii TaxID=97005 RepID=A0ABD2HZY3_HETSC
MDGNGRTDPFLLRSKQQVSGSSNRRNSSDLDSLAITTIFHTHLDEEAQGDAVAFKQQYQLSEELEKAWPIGGLFPCVPLWGDCIRMRQELIRQQREEHKGFVLELERNTQFVHQLKCAYICFHPTTNASSFICWLGLNK